jgi:ABC-type transporter Mla subunit MlaD
VLAHNLAQYANRSGVCNRWLDSVPVFIAELAKQDLVNSAVD